MEVAVIVVLVVEGERRKPSSSHDALAKAEKKSSMVLLLLLLFPPPPSPDPCLGLLRLRRLEGVDDRARGFVAVVVVVTVVGVGVVDALVVSVPGRGLRCRRWDCPLPALFERWCL